MHKLSSLTIFFPCLNDGKILPYLLTKTYAIAPMVARDFEVIIVENGSTNETLQILPLLEKQYPGLRVIRYNKPLGYGGALQKGFAHATKDWVFYTVGDGQYDPLELIRLVEKRTDSIDVVNGYKIKRADSWFRTTLGTVINNFLFKQYKPPIRDIGCDFRLIRRSLLKKFMLMSKNGTICLELIVKLKLSGARFAQVGVSHLPRAMGTSEHFRLSHIVKTLDEYRRFRISVKQLSESRSLAK